MTPRFFRLLLILGLAAAGPVRAQSPWTHLDFGMGEEQVYALIGGPLIVNAGHGYVHWTFDAGGSVMFREGLVLFWATPNGLPPAPLARPAARRQPLAAMAPARAAASPPVPAVAPAPFVAAPATVAAAPRSAPDRRELRPAVRVPTFAEITKS